MRSNIISTLFSLRRFRFLDKAARYPATKILLYRLCRNTHFAKSIAGKALVGHSRRKIEAWNNVPPKILIEPTSFCNASCSTCPQVYLTRPRGIMDMELYKSIVSQVSNMGIETITLTGFGEPLLDKTFIKKVGVARDFNVNVFFFTNAILLSERLSRGLLQFPNLLQINLSVGGSNFEEYCQERMYSNKKVNRKAMSNIKYLCNLKRKIPSRTVVNIQPVYPSEDVLKSLKIRRHWKRLGPDSVDGNIRHSFANEKMGVTPGHYSYVACKQLWDALMVLWDGRVAMCCEDVNGSYIIGDLKSEKLEDIIAGSKLSHLRKLHLEGKRSRIKSCRNCDIFSFWY